MSALALHIIPIRGWDRLNARWLMRLHADPRDGRRGTRSPGDHRDRPLRTRPGAHRLARLASDALSYPPMADLFRNFREIYVDLCDAIASVDDSTLSAVNPFEPARSAFPTAREFVPYLMTGHLAYHLGLLGDWRRAADRYARQDRGE